MERNPGYITNTIHQTNKKVRGMEEAPVSVCIGMKDRQWGWCYAFCYKTQEDEQHANHAINYSGGRRTNSCVSERFSKITQGLLRAGIAGPLKK